MGVVQRMVIEGVTCPSRRAGNVNPRRIFVFSPGVRVPAPAIVEFESKKGGHRTKR